MLEPETAQKIAENIAVLIIFGIIVLLTKWLYKRLFTSKNAPFPFLLQLIKLQHTVRISTHHSASVARNRLDSQVSESAPLLLFSPMLVGSVGSSRIQLRLHRPIVRRWAYREFEGWITSFDGKTIIQGKLQFSKLEALYWKLSFGFILMWGMLGIPGGIIFLLEGKPEGAFFLAAPFLMFATNTAFAMLALRIGSSEHNALAAALAEAVQGVVAPHSNQNKH